VNEDTLGFDSIVQAGVGGHFFGTSHTQERYKDAFYAPMISDWRNYESWEEAGSPRAWQKANKIWKQALEDYVEPPIDSAILEELDAHIAKISDAGGIGTDF